jgi:ribosomal protein L37AE/L43A
MKKVIKNKGSIFVEKLSHFRCLKCDKWWSIGDAPKKVIWYCPWCGLKQNFQNNEKNERK